MVMGSAAGSALGASTASGTFEVTSTHTLLPVASQAVNAQYPDAKHWM